MKRSIVNSNWNEVKEFFFFKYIVSPMFSTSSKNVTVNLLIYFAIFSSHHKTTSTMSQPIDVIIIIYSFHSLKKYTLYIIIHKVHFAAIPFLFVTSSDVFARKLSLNYLGIFSIIQLVLY